MALGHFFSPGNECSSVCELCLPCRQRGQGGRGEERLGKEGTGGVEGRASGASLPPSSLLPSLTSPPHSAPPLITLLLLVPHSSCAAACPPLHRSLSVSVLSPSLLCSTVHPPPPLFLSAPLPLAFPCWSHRPLPPHVLVVVVVDDSARSSRFPLLPPHLPLPPPLPRTADFIPPAVLILPRTPTQPPLCASDAFHLQPAPPILSQPSLLPLLCPHSPHSHPRAASPSVLRPPRHCRRRCRFCPPSSSLLSLRRGVDAGGAAQAGAAAERGRPRAQ